MRPNSFRGHWLARATAVVGLALLVSSSVTIAQDVSATDPRSIILLESDLEERAGPAEGQFITSAGGIWLPCDMAVAASSPLMIVNLDERGWLIQQVATAFPDEAAATVAMTSAREAISGGLLSQECTSPDDVLVFDVRAPHDAPVSVGDELVSAVGRAVINGDFGPARWPDEPACDPGRPDRHATHDPGRRRCTVREPRHGRDRHARVAGGADGGPSGAAGCTGDHRLGGRERHDGQRRGRPDRAVRGGIRCRPNLERDATRGPGAEGGSPSITSTGSRRTPLRRSATRSPRSSVPSTTRSATSWAAAGRTAATG